MKNYIKNGLKILAFCASVTLGSFIGSRTPTKTEKMTQYFEDKQDKYATRKWKDANIKDSIETAMWRYTTAQKAGINNQGAYAVCLGREKNFEVKWYTKEGLENIIDKTSDDLRYIKDDITRDSTEFEKYKVISDEINSWIKYNQ